MGRVRSIDERRRINAELAPFFTDLPARLASSHLVVSRSGAGTVAELAAIGRPSIRCRCPVRSTRTSSPMPACWPRWTGLYGSPQAEFTPDRLAAEISAFAAEPARLTAMAAAARKVAGLTPPNGWPIW